MFKKTKSKDVLLGPCINLPFVDNNFPELLGESIRLYQPKVGVKSAYKITSTLLKNEGKRPNYTIDTKSAKLCRNSQEFGYRFKAIKTKEED